MLCLSGSTQFLWFVLLCSFISNVSVSSMHAFIHSSTASTNPVRKSKQQWNPTTSLQEIPTVYSKPIFVTKTSTTRDYNVYNNGPSTKSNNHNYGLNLFKNYTISKPLEMERMTSQYSTYYDRSNNNFKNVPRAAERLETGLKLPKTMDAGTVGTGTMSQTANSHMSGTIINPFNAEQQDFYSGSSHTLEPLSIYGHTASYHPEHHHIEDEEADFEIEDKVFSKTLVGTKALKVGKFVFTLFMVLVVLILAALAKVGVSLPPVILPLALLPIGIIALLLFIPLFFIFIPIVATGLGGGKKRRRKRSMREMHLIKSEVNTYLSALENTLVDILGKIGTGEELYN